MIAYIITCGGQRHRVIAPSSCAAILIGMDLFGFVCGITARRA